MKYSILAEAYRSMETTSKRLELTDILVNLIKNTPIDLIKIVIYLTQGKLGPNYLGIEIGIADKSAIKSISLATGINQQTIRSRYEQIGDLGKTAEEFMNKKMQSTLFSESLTVEKIYSILNRISKTTGTGSLNFRLKLVGNIIKNSAPLESKYLMNTIIGKLRLGVADYTIIDSLAIAYTGNKSNRNIIEHAYNISSDLGYVAEVLSKEGIEGIQKFRIEVGKPIRPMLAERLDNSELILQRVGGRCAVEYKIDGERLQIHKNGRNISIFSRRLENITTHYPDAIQLCINNIENRKCVLEAEAVAINVDSGEYLPFQDLMHRRRKHGINEAIKKYPIVLNFFDVLYVDEEDHTSKTYSERRKILEKTVKANDRMKIINSIVTDNSHSIERFMDKAIYEGSEGIMIKDLNSVYRAGAREFSWIKLKNEYKGEFKDTIDLTIIGAFHGRGRRAGRYGAFLLAALDINNGTYNTVCKIGTGFTDRDLEEIPRILTPYKIPYVSPEVNSRMKADVWFTPQIVIEIIASEVTLSPIHTASIDVIRKDSGLALRFPKFTGNIRKDKSPSDSTTTNEILSIYKKQSKKVKSN